MRIGGVTREFKMSGAQDGDSIYAQCTSLDTHQTLLTVSAKDLRVGFHHHQLDMDKCLCCKTISEIKEEFLVVFNTSYHIVRNGK